MGAGDRRHALTPGYSDATTRAIFPFARPDSLNACASFISWRANSAPTIGRTFPQSTSAVKPFRAATFRPMNRYEQQTPSSRALSCDGLQVLRVAVNEFVHTEGFEQFPVGA